MDDYRDVRIDSKIKSRKPEVGETMTFIYDYSSDWSRKVKLVEILLKINIEEYKTELADCLYSGPWSECNPEKSMTLNQNG